MSKSKDALLVIDVQNGFVSSKTEGIIDDLIKYIKKFDGCLKIATKFVNSGGGFKDIMHWDRLKAYPEIEVLKEVAQNVDYVIEKNVYTACTKEVMKLLKDNKIEQVFLVGIDTDCCVLKTAIDLFENNIRPIVETKHCASNGGPESHLAAIKVLERTIGREQII